MNHASIAEVRRRAPALLAALCLATFARAISAVAAAPAPALVFACAPDNDLYRAVADGGRTCPRHDDPLSAVEAAPEGAGVLLLADRYPDKTQAIPESAFQRAVGKRLRLYVEYPASLPGVKWGEPRNTKWERGVITSDAFGSSLKPMRILAIHDCRFVPVRGGAGATHIVVARVAGFDTAVYGLPDQGAWPILFEHPEGRMLVATTKLSQFVTARYAPADAWRDVWRMILSRLQPGTPPPKLKWTPVVRPGYGPDEPLPADAERRAIRRGNEWVLNARMLIHPSWRDADWAEEPKEGRMRVEFGRSGNAGARFALPAGDGSAGMLEGFRSRIRHDGSQDVCWALRTDCTGEEAAPFVLAGRLLNEPRWVDIGRNLADFVLFKFDDAAPWRDPAHPAHGLIGWACPPTMREPVDQTGAFYGVISARVAMSALAAAGALGDDRWDERVLRVILANHRTTGRSGLRPVVVGLKSLEQKGWRHYYERPPTKADLSAFPTAQLLAANLLVHQSTGYRPLLERTRTGLRLLMDAYPDKLRWFNGMQQERARLILPLAWLVRVEDTTEHRAWLKRIVGDLLANQVPCGAIRDEVGKPGTGVYPAPASNEAYGTAESPLIQENGDPVCDLLYTLNSAFLGLHEAAAATSDPALHQAEDRLAAFLCRIQARSERRRELDGAWFRAFDFNRWEYWASNADLGWGAWCVETGWVQGWIVTTFALRQLNTTLWELAGKRPLARLLDKNLRELLE